MDVQNDLDEMGSLQRRRVTDRMNIDDVTLGEVYRGMLSFRLEVNQRLDAVNSRLENKVVSSEVYKIAHDQLQKEVEDIRSDNEFLKQNRRTIITGMVIAVVTGISSSIVSILTHIKLH